MRAGQGVQELSALYCGVCTGPREGPRMGSCMQCSPSVGLEQATGSALSQLGQEWAGLDHWFSHWVSWRGPQELWSIGQCHFLQLNNLDSSTWCRSFHEPTHLTPFASSTERPELADSPYLLHLQTGVRNGGSVIASSMSILGAGEESLHLPGRVC